VAENYFDTQALLGVVIRDPTILGADITGTSVTVNANYDWPESGKPFVPGYSLSMNPDTGLSVYQASSPSSGGLVLEMLTADNEYTPWYFDRMELYTGSFSSVYITKSRFLDGQVEYRELTDFSTTSAYPDTQQYIQKGVQAVGELIITDRQTYDPYTDTYPDAPASLGVSSRASFNYNPQNITKSSQMVMRTSNQGDTQYAAKDTILEIDKAGRTITPKIGPGSTVSAIKIVSGTQSGATNRASIQLQGGSTRGLITITGGTQHTGPLDVTGTFSVSTSATFQDVDVLGTIEVPTPTQPTHATTKDWVETYVAANGGTPSDTGWLDCTLASGWVASTAAGQAPTVQARKIGNQVRFRGRASGTLTVGATTTILTIPTECRPPIDSNMNAVATTGGFTGWSNATSAGVLSVHFKSPFATGAAVIEFTGMSYLTN